MVYHFSSSAMVFLLKTIFSLIMCYLFSFYYNCFFIHKLNHLMSQLINVICVLFFLNGLQNSFMDVEIYYRGVLELILDVWHVVDNLNHMQ